MFTESVDSPREVNRVGLCTGRLLDSVKRALGFDVILAANDQRLYCEAYVVCRQNMPNGTVSTVLRENTSVGRCL